MPNDRVFYALQQAGVAVDGSSTYIPIHGLQSVGITTNFNLNFIHELGQLETYQIIEMLPEVEISLEKVFDGSPPLWHLATNGSTVPGLLGRSPTKASYALAVFAQSHSSASGAGIAEVQMSGLFPSQWSASFPVEGNFTESFTAVGNNKVWTDIEGGGTAVFSGGFAGNNDSPFSLTYTGGGVQQRWHLLYAPVSGSPAGLDENGCSKAWQTVLPREIPGVSASGTMTNDSAGRYAAPIQNISISTDLGRDTIYELGKKDYYTRYVNFPVDVKTDIEVSMTKFDNVSATAAGGVNGAPDGYNTNNQTIRVQLQDGSRIDTGTRNKLTNVTYGGGDAGGGNVSVRYSYTGQNTLNFYHPQDPAGLSG